MATIEKKIEFNIDDVVCSGLKLSTILRKINNKISDAFTEISISRQSDHYDIEDALENVEAYLCEMQDIISGIK